MKRILVPTDFSRQSEHALDLAHEIAARTGAEVLLVHIVEQATTSVFAGAGELITDSADQENAVQILEAAKEKVQEISNDPRFHNIRLKHITKAGSPFSSISKVISKEDADLLIMGTSGTSNLEDWFVGSNTEKVVRMAKCPVISVPQPFSLKDIKRIVFPTNFDINARLVEHLKGWLKICNATLYLLRVNTPHNYESPHRLQEQLLKTASEYQLENFETYVESNITVEGGILNFTEQYGGDMIAMATHGKRGLFHLFSGSIAEDVVNHTLKPVWTLSLKS